MEKFNADNMFDPIEVQLGGKTYTVGHVGQDMLEKVADAKGDVDSGVSAIDVQLSAFLGVPESNFRDLDSRCKTATVRYPTRVIGKQLAGEELGNVSDEVLKGSVQ